MKDNLKNEYDLNIPGESKFSLLWLAWASLKSASACLYIIFCKYSHFTWINILSQQEFLVTEIKKNLFLGHKTKHKEFLSWQNDPAKEIKPSKNRIQGNFQI